MKPNPSMKLLRLLLLAVLPMALSACSEDSEDRDDSDGDVPAPENKFLGTWTLTQDGPGEIIQLDFNADGTWSTSAAANKLVIQDDAGPMAQDASGTYVVDGSAAWGPMVESPFGSGTMTATIDGQALSVDFLFAGFKPPVHERYAGTKP